MFFCSCTAKKHLMLSCFIFVAVLLLLTVAIFVSGCTVIGDTGQTEASLGTTDEMALPPVPEVTISSETPVLGDHLIIRLENMKEVPHIDIETDIAGDLSQPFAYEAGVKMLKGIDYYNEPGEYTLQIEVTGALGNTWREKLEIEILDGDFPKQEFSVTIDRPEEWTEENLEKQGKLVKTARKESSPEPLWEGDFIWPLEGEITSEFGAIRIINQGAPNRHSGIDIAEDTGTSVKAANYGEVKLAEKLVTMGNTVIIDHGVGLTSEYLHLNEIKVEAGEFVSKGEIIGEVGETGFATGPHLHWQIYLNDTPVNPGNFLGEE